MDGNARWARERGLPLSDGYSAGAESLRRCVALASRLRIAHLTVFALSEGNLRRPPAELAAVFDAIGAALARALPELHAAGVRLCFASTYPRAVPAALQAALCAAARLTQRNQGTCLTVAVAYSGRRHAAAAARALAARAQAGRLRPEEVNEDIFETALRETASPPGWAGEAAPARPPPDLLLRSGGEQRLSDFLLLELAWTELQFSTSLWPDVREAEVAAALAAFAGRRRRFGGREGEDE